MPYEEEIRMLRDELEMLMGERQQLLEIVGAAAGLVASLDSNRLPVGAIESADMVATKLNLLSEETLQDALASVHAEIEAEETVNEARA
jgi:pyrroloquinoline quinone (PQQ) biosynthesis protein C